MRDSVRLAPFSFLAVLALVAPAAAQSGAPSAAAAPSPAAAKPAEEAFKNIQVLKGIPATRLIPTMRLISGALGVDCDYCHVGTQRERDKDDKVEKQTARKMITMMRAINTDSFEGKMEVTCATCHQGHAKPISVPQITQLALGEIPKPQAPPPAATPAAQLPTADQVLDHYFEAIGGKPAAERVTSRVLKGTVVATNGQISPIEIYRQAPDRLLTATTTPRGTLTRGYNGRAGWQKTAEGQAALEGTELEDLRRAADFYADVKIKERFLKMAVTAKTQVLDRAVYVVEARSEDARVRLMFDAENGLLVRRVVLTITPLGLLPEETDYGDYRVVDGIKVPFMVRRSTARNSATQKFTEIKQNVAIEAAKFDMPAGDTKP